MLEYLNDIDNQLFLMLHSAFRNGFLDSFMKMFSGRWVWVPFYISIALTAMLNRTDWKRLGGFLVAVGIAIALTDQTCATFIRPAVARLRPSNLDNPISSMVMVVNGYRGGSYGFPSCHAANSMALAMFISLAFRRRWFTIFIFGWAVVNSLSRIYLGVHYPGDLLVGGCIGACIAILCYYGWYFAVTYSSPHTPPLRPARQVWIPVLTASVTALVLAIISIARTISY